jgi:hypothetical protein
MSGNLWVAEEEAGRSPWARASICLQDFATVTYRQKYEIGVGKPNVGVLDDRVLDLLGFRPHW